MYKANEVAEIDQKRISECSDYINKEKIKRVAFDMTSYKLNHVDILYNCPTVKEVLIFNHSVENFEGLYSLNHLKYLYLKAPSGEIDFSLLKNLREVELFWNKNVKGLDKTESLKKLKLIGYKMKTLRELSNLSKLEELSIIQSSIISLEGCGNLKKLKSLALCYLRNLEYISEIEKNAKTLKDLEFYSCKKLINHEYTSCLSELEWLKFNNCGEIKSLGFIKKLPNLKKIAFVDTNIVDGDLSPCIGLEFVGFNNKKHYSHKFSELNPNFRN